MDKFETISSTYEHKQLVNQFISMLITRLLARGICHDDSKLKEPELSIFTEYTSKLATCTYGSEEYRQFLKEMKPALDHHYAVNTHHPEHFLNGIKDMTLIDLIEMICDWKASALRHNDGNILISIDKNQERFGYSNELAQILKNTVKLFE